MPELSANALDQLLDYDWPGNIRELQNVIERAMILSDGAALRVPYLEPAFPPTPVFRLPGDSSASRELPGAGWPARSSDRLADVNKAHILRVLADNQMGRGRTERRCRAPADEALDVGLSHEKARDHATRSTSVTSLKRVSSRARVARESRPKPKYD